MPTSTLAPNDRVQHLAVRLYAVARRELDGEPHERAELVAWVHLAAAEVDRLTALVSTLRNGAPSAPPSLAVVKASETPAAVKCRHVFDAGGTVDGKQVPPKCDKCGALKKTNGRPRSVPPVVT